MSIYSPNTSRVLRSFDEIGVPVNPIYVAFGSVLRMILAVPITRFATSSPSSFFVIFIFSTSPYCPLCASSAITTILFRSDSGSSDSSNFCIVVKIIPFACLPASKVFRFSRLSACIGFANCP